MTRSPRPLAWRQISWQRPLEPTHAAAALRQWAADQRSPGIVLETRLSPGGAVYLLGHAVAARQVPTALRTIPGTSLASPLTDRLPVSAAGRLRASTRHRPLRIDDPEATIRAILAATLALQRNEMLLLQIVLGPRRIPLAVPNQSPSSMVAPWWQVAWRGDGGQIDGEKRSALRTKVSDHGFACTIRLGVIAAPSRRGGLLLTLLAALRISEAPGVRLTLRRESAAQLDLGARPCRWPLRLGVPELVGLTGWPLGDAELPGQPPMHPKLLPPPPGTSGGRRSVGEATAGRPGQTLALPIQQALHHLHVLGPTGTGKSTLLANLILQDIAAGRGVVVVEPKGDLIDDVLARIPKQRQGDVVVIDPADSAPVGLNPLGNQSGAHAADRRSSELAADNLLAVLKQLYGASIGPRSADILYGGLLTLSMRPDTSIAMLPLVLTNPGFRRSLTKDVRDPLVLEPFWATFDNWSDAERLAAVAPVMNKLRPLLRPGLRNVLGQRRPRFRMSQVFTEHKILLVPLRRGLIGPEAASLLGSILVADLWQTIQARSQIPAARRHPVSVVLDELQDYLHLPTDIGDALAQSRGYGVAFTLAHQYLGQLGRDVRSAVLSNARSRVAFQLPHEDAIVLEKAHPEIAAVDFESLGQHEVYASLFAGGQVTPYASGRTRGLTAALQDPGTIRELSRRRYGQPLDDIEAGFTAVLEQATGPELGPTGRRRRQP
jgi:Type IV secretion-system coupling protein DNA-binding domain